MINGPNWDGLSMTKGRSDDEKLTPHEIDLDKGNSPTAHGTPGHTGFRCKQCAQNSDVVVEAYPLHAPDLWTKKQIEWQEACDEVFREFDDAVAAHFPNHLPAGCVNCPVPPALPIKPEPPYERG